MNGGVYFDGDPATDSARRHMERVLKGEPTQRWPWMLVALGSGALWMLYRVGRTIAADRASAPHAARKSVTSDSASARNSTHPDPSG